MKEKKSSKLVLSEYKTPAQIVLEKLKNNEKLYPNDKAIILAALEDPLQEFCKREAPFRLMHMHNLSKASEEFIDDAEEAIRDVIDYNEVLYDAIDNDIAELFKDHKGEYNYNKEEK